MDHAIDKRWTAPAAAIMGPADPRCSHVRLGRWKTPDDAKVPLRNAALELNKGGACSGKLRLAAKEPGAGNHAIARAEWAARGPGTAIARQKVQGVQWKREGLTSRPLTPLA